MQFLVEIVVFSLLLGAGGLATRSAVMAWTQFRAGVGKPLLIHTSPQGLADLRPAWPFRERRWPRPATAGQSPMHRAEASAYARLARRGQRRSVIAGQALGIIGGAWLGTVLPTTWELLASGNGIDIKSSMFFQLVAVLLLVELALLLSDHAHDYEAVRTVYHRHATRLDSGVLALTAARVSRAKRFRRWLRSGN